MNIFFIKMEIKHCLSKDDQLEFIFNSPYFGINRIYFEIARNELIYCEVEAEEKYEIAGAEIYSTHRIEKGKKEWIFQDFQIGSIKKIFADLCEKKLCTPDIWEIFHHEYYSRKSQNELISKVLLNDIVNSGFEETKKKLKEVRDLKRIKLVEKDIMLQRKLT